jgi:hypothetical protein
MAAKQAKFEARERPDGLYDLHLMAANGEHLWNDSQGRPRGNVRRDLARIRRAAVNAGLIFVAKS